MVPLSPSHLLLLRGGGFVASSFWSIAGTVRWGKGEEGVVYIRGFETLRKDNFFLVTYRLTLFDVVNSRFADVTFIDTS